MKFEDDIEIDSLAAQEELGVVNIDTDLITEESKVEASLLIQDIKKMYLNNDFLEKHPDVQIKLHNEINNLKKLLKLSKSNEITHDLLVKAIGNKPENASLYGSLSKMQTTMLSIQKQIDDLVLKLSNFLKDYQMEINFNEPSEDGDEENDNIYRGTKGYIEEMKKKANETGELELFENK